MNNSSASDSLTIKITEIISCYLYAQGALVLFMVCHSTINQYEKIRNNVKALLWNSTQQSKRINLILFKARKGCQKDCIVYIFYLRNV